MVGALLKSVLRLDLMKVRPVLILIR